MAKVKEIQVCGGKFFDHLYYACVDYIKCRNEGVDREKLNFTVTLDSGETKHITFRQEDDGVHVYGDFEGMPNFLQWSQRVLGVDSGSATSYQESDR